MSARARSRTCTRSSVPTSLGPLLAIGVAMDVLELFIDELFHLDSASSPQLRQSGTCRGEPHHVLRAAVGQGRDAQGAAAPALLLVPRPGQRSWLRCCQQ